MTNEQPRLQQLGDAERHLGRYLERLVTPDQ